MEFFPVALGISCHYALPYGESVQYDFLLLLIITCNISPQREGVACQSSDSYMWYGTYIKAWKSTV